MKELDQIVGLEPVKMHLKELEDMVSLQAARRRAGQNLASQTLHMVFTGNPGTGKTTVARIAADMFKALGVVSKGHLIKVTREDLVAGYIGQTAPQTKAVIQRAIGGILFIDEAYSLTRGGSEDFGKEAIDTLVKGMEEYRDNLVVILAGYTDEMEEFIRPTAVLNGIGEYVGLIMALIQQESSGRHLDMMQSSESIGVPPGSITDPVLEFLSINEIKRILGVPEWFDFPEHTQKIRKYEILGQSVDCRVIKAIANRIAYTFMKVKTDKIKKTVQSYTVSNSGQLELLLS